MKKIKISNWQIFSLSAGITIGGSVLVVTPLMSGIAKQDAWIGAAFSVLFGLPIVGIYVFLGTRFPEMNYVGMAKAILGKRLGTLVSISTVLLFLQLAYHIPWYIGNFMTSQVMSETPLSVFIALFLAAVAVALRYGPEAFARASEIFLLVASFLFVMAMVLVLPNCKPQNLQPVLENGILPALKSSFFLSAFLSVPLLMVMMIYPFHAGNPKNGGKSILLGYLWGGLVAFVSIFMTILVLGWQISAKTRFPAYLLAKQIDVGVIFSRIEIIISVSWILTQFIISCMVFYAGITGLADLLNLKSHKGLILPMTLVFFTLSQGVFPDVIYQENWIVFAWVPYIYLHGLIIPVILVVAYLVKKRFPPSHSSNL